MIEEFPELEVKDEEVLLETKRLEEELLGQAHDEITLDESIRKRNMGQKWAYRN